MERTITRDIDPLSFPKKKALLLLLRLLDSPSGLLRSTLGDMWRGVKERRRGIEQGCLLAPIPSHLELVLLVVFAVFASDLQQYR